jgi:hypothetical protein
MGRCHLIVKEQNILDRVIVCQFFKNPLFKGVHIFVTDQLSTISTTHTRTWTFYSSGTMPQDWLIPVFVFIRFSRSPQPRNDMNRSVWPNVTPSAGKLRLIRLYIPSIVRTIFTADERKKFHSIMPKVLAFPCQWRLFVVVFLTR